MSIQQSIDAQDQDIETQKTEIIEKYSLDNEGEEMLENLIAKSIKYGELCKERDTLPAAIQ